MKLYTVLATLVLTTTSMVHAGSIADSCKEISADTFNTEKHNLVLSGHKSTIKVLDTAKVSGLNSEDSIIYATGCPTEIPMYGYTIYNNHAVIPGRVSNQNAAIRFTPDVDYQLTNIAVWVMNDSETYHGNLKLSLHEDKVLEDHTLPADEFLHKWVIEEIRSPGWDPQLEIVSVDEYVVLEANKNYWIVVESDAQRGESPVWNIAQHTQPAYMANALDDEWQGGAYSAPVSISISGVPLH